jgi:nitrite reductase (NAD(P)H)
MGIDVASFGDFFADAKSIDAQIEVVSRVEKPDKAQPAVHIAIGDSPQTGMRMPKSRKDEPIKCLIYNDPFGSTYKKYIFTADGKYLLGGQMIGDVADYVKLVSIVKKKVWNQSRYQRLGNTQRTKQKALETPPSELIIGAKKEGADGGDDLDDDAQVCSCHVCLISLSTFMLEC